MATWWTRSLTLVRISDPGYGVRLPSTVVPCVTETQWKSFIPSSRCHGLCFTALWFFTSERDRGSQCRLGISAEKTVVRVSLAWISSIHIDKSPMGWRLIPMGSRGRKRGWRFPRCLQSGSSLSRHPVSHGSIFLSFTTSAQSFHTSSHFCHPGNSSLSVIYLFF